jgi:hypothetical protein
VGRDLKIVDVTAQQKYKTRVSKGVKLQNNALFLISGIFCVAMVVLLLSPPTSLSTISFYQSIASEIPPIVFFRADLDYLVLSSFLVSTSSPSTP